VVTAYIVKKNSGKGFLHQVTGHKEENPFPSLGICEKKYFWVLPGGEGGIGWMNMC
jgi:hypothetical protein